jgi:poly(3-hydroxybutyrate) depolymerase
MNTNKHRLKRRKVFIIIVVLAMCSAVFAEKITDVGKGQKVIRVLFVGNSLTFYYEMPKVLYNLLSSNKQIQPFYIFMDAPGGFTLEQHYSQGQTPDIIQKGNWDYVVLQEGSHVTITDKQKFVDYSRKLDEQIKKAGAKTIFYMTWAYQNSDPNMFGQVADAYTKIAEDVNAIVVPVGLAWQKALKEAKTIELYDKDNVHQSPAGTYLTACVFYITLTGRNPQGLPNAGLNMLKKDDVDFLQKTAWQTISEMDLAMPPVGDPLRDYGSDKKQRYMTQQAFENFEKSQQLRQQARKDIFEKVFVQDVNENYNYLVYKPQDYEKKKDWPMILFLHGAGERGNDLEIVMTTALPQLLEAGKDLPFVVICPQCPKKQVWDEDKLSKLLDKAVEKYSIDKGRIYLTGISMGGYGSWSLGCAYPERFAAIAPICSGGSARQAAKLKDVPIWAFHGQMDEIVLPSESQDMVDAVNKASGNAKITIYPDAGHDAWTRTYNNNELYEWFIEHNLRQREKQKDER